MLEWKISKPEQEGTRGLDGLREVGKSVGASCLGVQSERYCFLEISAHRGLPHLLADY
jgi:hypothetical protein